MKRRGATLVEVLVAIFVMALGMLALLTLFPLGALRMAQAIQDDRAAQCATNANAICTMRNIRQDPTVVYEPDATDPTGRKDAFTSDLDNLPFSPNNGPVFAPDPNGPSNPVLVDPAGYQQALGQGQRWVGGLEGLIPRRRTSFDLGAPDRIYRWFTLLDDYEFERVGSPQRIPGELSFPNTRDLAYSWTYMMQRPKASDPNVVNVSVMVFRRRPMALTTQLNLRELVYQTAGAAQQKFDVNRSVVTIDHSVMGEPPPVKAGDWILDASIAQAGGKRYSHANFYRVVSVTELNDTQTELEVQTPLRGFAAPFPQPSPGVFTGTVIIFEGLVEVFERGAGWK